VKRSCLKSHRSDRKGNIEDAETTCSDYQTVSSKQKCCVVSLLTELGFCLFLQLKCLNQSANEDTDVFADDDAQYSGRNVLETKYGMSDAALEWHRNYLRERSCSVVYGGNTASKTDLHCYKSAVAVY